MEETSFCFTKLGLASDHAGKELKADLLLFLREQGFDPIDYGVSADSNGRVDYPDYAAQLAAAISEKKIEAGIAICGTGIGMSIVANKFKGVRATCVWDEFTARMSRAHNDANVLCLGARLLTSHRARDFLKIWLSTSFAGDQHKKRLEKIEKLEKKLLNSR